ncbi:MAG TPA: N-acetylneuraminate synthase family protein [Vicinamibacterales bacterium]|nr:N-acetylneuraminate synthase family protein [Vicinamibacterales bacterium]
MRAVTIGRHRIGPGERVLIVAEIGINHNGSLDLALRLVRAAAAAGCHAVKFQKRTIDAVYSVEELARPRPTPFGMTNGDLKRGLELGWAEYTAIDAACRDAGLMWFASCWDHASVDFIARFDPPCFKIASPCLTDHDLLRHHRRLGKPLLLSTGMSTLEQIDAAVDVLGTEALVLMHCTSSYPSAVDELNLRLIGELAQRYNVPIGYSGHEVGLSTTVAAVALGAAVIERHLTLDRAMWGSDQAASVEPDGFAKLVKYVNAVERALGDGVKRVYDSEVAAMQKLRRVPR